LIRREIEQGNGTLIANGGKQVAVDALLSDWAEYRAPSKQICVDANGMFWNDGDTQVLEVDRDIWLWKPATKHPIYFIFMRQSNPAAIDADQ